MQAATTWPNHMIITKQQISMIKKPYFAPEIEFLETMPYEVYCISPFPGTGEDRDPWNTDND